MEKQIMTKLQKFVPSCDKTLKYTVKEVADMTGLSGYTIRYYDNSGLIPGVGRAAGNSRKFSEYSLSWLRLVHCLRATGLPIEGVRRYIRLCDQGESTIPERAEIIFAQEESLRKQIEELHCQLEVLEYKKHYYQELLAGRECDARCNPAAVPESES